MKENLESYNDSKTVEYYFSLNRFSLFDYEKEIVESFFDKKESVLDIGCGAGRTTSGLSRLGFDVLGIDFSKFMILKAKSCYPKINFRVCNVLDLTSLGNNLYGNVIFSFNGISLLKFNELEKAFIQVWNVMKKSGVFFFTTPYLDNKVNSEYWKDKIKKNSFNILTLEDRIKLGSDIVYEENISFAMQIPFVNDIQSIISKLGYRILFMGPRLTFFSEEKCEGLLDDNYLWVIRK